jgi:phage baseplate assembly protein V
MTPGAANSIAIAKVIDNRDPEGLGRVVVSFPWLEQSMHTDWIPVAQPHAGKDRGVFWMPEIDDELVVGFLHGDTAKPVVLGALWSHVAPAPSRDPRERVLRSKNGHTIRFLDSTPTAGDKGALVIEDAHGSRIVMGNGIVRIVAKGTLEISANALVLSGTGWKRTVTPNSNPI